MAVPENNFKMNDQIDGFLVKAVTEINDLKLMAIQLEHIKSGARVLHLYTDDAENLSNIRLSYQHVPACCS